MSLINDALKRASDAQAQAHTQAQTRPRGPKGVEDLPVPMTPAVTPERRPWVPVVGMGLVLVLLLGASGFFFAKWLKARQAWQPYAAEDIDEKGMPKAKAAKAPVTPVPTATNPPVAIPPPVPPPAVVATNPVVPPPTPPPPTNPPPPKVEPPTVAMTNVPPPPKPPTPPVPPKPVVPPAVEFPDLKLQGISRGKKKTFIIINGRTLSLGERIEGVTLLKIDADSVTVEKDGVKRELFLLR